MDNEKAPGRDKDLKKGKPAMNSKMKKPKARKGKANEKKVKLPKDKKYRG